MRTSAWVGVCVLFALVGCRSAPLQTHPFADGAHAPEQLWEVDWWTRVVPYRIWEYEPREVATPAVDPDTQRVYTLTRDGGVRCLAPGGKVEWEFKAAGPFAAGAAVSAGVLYVPGGNGTLYALKARTGELVWKYDAKEELASVPVIVGDRVLVASVADTLFAVNTADGVWAWQHRRELPSGFTIRGVSQPVVAGANVYQGFADGTFVALSAADGTLVWERPLGGGTAQFLDVDTTAIVDEAAGHIYVASYQGGMYALESATGEVTWQNTVSGLTSMIWQGETLYVAGDGQLAAYRVADGTSQWTLRLGDRAARAPLLARGMLIVPVNNALLFVDPITGRERTAWDPGEGVSATPAWTGANLIVLSNKGFVYSLYLPARRG